MIEFQMWSWPQYLMLLWLTASVIIHGVNDGKPADLNYSFNVSLIKAALLFIVLYQGGFFMRVA